MIQWWVCGVMQWGIIIMIIHPNLEHLVQSPKIELESNRFYRTTVGHFEMMHFICGWTLTLRQHYWHMIFCTTFHTYAEQRYTNKYITELYQNQQLILTNTHRGMPVISFNAVRWLASRHGSWLLQQISVRRPGARTSRRRPSSGLVLTTNSFSNNNS